MRKILAFILSLVVIFAPVYSYAVLPIIATAASAAGRILLGNAVKKPTAIAMRRGFRPCIGSIQAAMGCASIGLGIADLLRDEGYTVEEGDTINNNINIEIYKYSLCHFEMGFGPDKLQAAEYYSKLLSSYPNSKSVAGELQIMIDIEKRAEEVYANKPYSSWRQGTSLKPKIQMIKSDGSYYTSSTVPIYHYTRCIPHANNKIYISDDELNTIIDQSLNNLTIDARKQLYKNIYNYDYSQHPNITINNNSTSGDSINNAIKNAPKEFEVSVELGDKINNNQVDMDDINDQNCTKNNLGQYDKCGEPDPDDPDDPDNPDNPDNPEPPEPPPIECSANGLYQKICNWMDWTQQPHSPADDGKLDIIDKSDELLIDNDRINFGNQCPAPTPINTSVGGFPVSTELDYQPLCDFFTMLNPFVIGMGGISSALIIAGGARRG